LEGRFSLSRKRERENAAWCFLPAEEGKSRMALSASGTAEKIRRAAGSKRSRKFFHSFS
jgi:hypothetical protein